MHILLVQLQASIHKQFLSLSGEVPRLPRGGRLRDSNRQRLWCCCRYWIEPSNFGITASIGLYAAFSVDVVGMASFLAVLRYFAMGSAADDSSALRFFKSFLGAEKIVQWHFVEVVGEWGCS